MFQNNNQVYLIKSPLLQNNTYIIVKNDQVVIIDPSFNSAKIEEYLKNHNLKLIGIILTHGHFDHVGDSFELAQKYECKIYVHELELEILKNHNYSQMWRKKIIIDEKLLVIFNEDKIKISVFEFDVFLTPGHTQGSICLKYQNYLFCGDLLFYDSIGRTDLFSGSTKDINNSIAKIVKMCNDQDFIMTGHDKILTLKELLSKNKMVIEILKNVNIN